MRKYDQITAEQWFDELDQDTQQETAIKYLRRLDSKSLKNLLAAIDLFRQGDAILKNKVKDPEPNPEDESLPDSVIK